MNKVSARKISNTRSGVLAASLLGACALACGSAAAAGMPRLSINPAMPRASSAQAPTGVACGTITITQSSTQTITTANSVSCNGGAPNFLHTDNSYFRAFDLAALGAPDGLDVCEVQVGVEQATSTSGTQPVTINLYTSDPLFPSGYPGSLTSIGSATAAVPDAAGGTVYSIPVAGSAPAGSQLVVEVFTPDGSTDGNSFFIGSNADAETGPSYLMASECGIMTPTTTTDIGFAGMHIVLNAIGNAPAVDDTIFVDGFDGAPVLAP